ncbi:transglycosylase domain-containing protein [Peribacillus alkalitolerans]|uniref:transglycosylase domain-containing protein n=1 Tax=Peribacillus alkalitolerans TaxID=1550385 RepID=UPI0013D463B9|nr:PBP1A family penicillin-binding protein [Peribacillus alkalitolerans]
MEVMARQRFKKSAKYVRAGIIILLMGIIIASIIYGSILIYAKILGAPPLAVPQSSLYYSSDGSIIGESHSGQKRYWVTIDEISPYLIDSAISVEDRKFYDHGGFDLRRIAGAVLADIKAMAKVQGASTITQQYARNLFLEHDKTWKRKINEALYTIRIEMNYSKEQILEGYLNTIYFGHGAYGVQAASLYYFGKDAKDLTLAEASMLAGIPKGPSRYSPFVSMEHAKSRQKIVLRSLKEVGIISEKQMEQAIEEKIKLTGQHVTVKEKVAPYFQDAVKLALKNNLGLDEKTIELGGLKVYTTLNLEYQAQAEKSFESIISNSSEIQGALVAMDPKTGEVKALVGGKDYNQSPFNRATQAVRQPGSTIKPLLYYTALEHGFTPSTTLRSEATTFTFDDGRASYAPRNFNHQYADGEITMAQAIALSDNIYAVKTHLFMGEEALINAAKTFGIKSKMKNLPSLALGTSGVRVIEMVNAYSMIANNGKKVEPVFIKRVENYHGEVLFEAEEEKHQVLDPDQAFVMTSLLTGVFDKRLDGYATVTGTTIIPKLTRQYAGKSGTTKSDSWMIGYTPQLVAGVWTGYDHSQYIEKPAEKLYAKQIWADFMEKSLKGTALKTFKPTKNVVGTYVNPMNGKLATSDCPISRLTYYVKGSEPTEFCMDHNHVEPIKNEPAPKEKKKKPWYKLFWN